jgi:hypothetical protein
MVPAKREKNSLFIRRFCGELKIGPLLAAAKPQNYRTHHAEGLVNLKVRAQKKGY